MTVIVKQAVRDAARRCRVSSDFYDALDSRVQEMIEEAERRAQANNRQTIQPRDL